MLEDKRLKTGNNMLPSYFKPILWSYDFSLIDVQKNKKTIIVNTINYGDLKHWRWVAKFYGKETVREILIKIPPTEMRSRARRLASIIFNIHRFNYAPRGTR